MIKLRVAKIGDDILKQKARKIDLDAEYSYIKDLSEAMIDVFFSMESRIGLAAPQVFHDIQLVVFRIPNMTHPRYQTKSEEFPLTMMINPTWSPLSNEKDCGWEACISLPNLMGKVPRYRNIKCEYQSIDGEFNTIDLKGFPARVVQHECDHLDGVVFTQRMDDISSLCFEDIALKSLSKARFAA